MKDKFSKFSLPLLWIFAFLVIILMITFTSHAESSAPLPYIVSNENIDGFPDFLSQCVYANSSNQVFLNAYNDENYFGYDYYEGGYHCFAFYVPQENFSYSFLLSTDYDSFDMTTNACQMTFNNYIFIKGRTEQGPRGWYFYGVTSRNNVSTDTTVSFFANTNKGDGNMLVPNISSQNYVYNDDEYQVVFGFGDPERPIIPTGHATPPGEPIEPEFTTGHATPPVVPSPITINNYTWTISNPPPIDTTDLQSTVESFIDVVNYLIGWLAQNLKGEFQNLLSNLKALFDYVVETIQYYGKLFLDGINQLVSFLYNNFVSLFESSNEYLHYVGHAPEPEPIAHAWESSSMYGVYGTFIDFFDDFHDAFDIEEPDEFILTIHVENISTFYNFGVLSPVIIHLDDHFYPIRSALRTFLWIIVSFGAVFVIEHGLSNFIRGSNNVD